MTELGTYRRHALVVLRANARSIAAIAHDLGVLNTLVFVAPLRRTCTR